VDARSNPARCERKVLVLSFSIDERVLSRAAIQRSP
jgi:hypothetical protein